MSTLAICRLASAGGHPALDAVDCADCAAILLGPHWIRFEKDPSHAETARSRLVQARINLWFAEGKP